MRCVALFLFTVVFVLLGGRSADANTIAAQTCQQNHVETALQSAATGDTVTVPAGNCTWSELTLPNDKDLTLTGAGSNQTVITCPVTPSCLMLPNNRTHVISGFHFMVTSSDESQPAILEHRLDAPVPGKYHRVHGNAFTYTGPARADVRVRGEPTTNCDGPTQIHPSVLYDHNEFTNVRVLVLGTNCAGTEPPLEINAQHRLWAQTPPIGSWPEIVYVEANTFVSFASTGTPEEPAQTLINFVDTNYGGRCVARFNRIESTANVMGSYAEIHGVQGLNRASPWKEIYENTHEVGVENFFGLAFIRSGSGVVWGNRVGANAQEMRFDVNRVWNAAITNPGPCNGSNAWDGNAPGQNGYPCRDQIGRMKDNAVWIHGGTPPSQDLAPFYFWDNLKGGTTQYIPAIMDHSPSLAPYVVENRDWYTQNLAFNGTTGVGVGAIAARPATCTGNVAYWATDQGSWNTTLALNTSGRLDKCLGAPGQPGTWQSAYYVPYAYPHPATRIPPAAFRTRDFNGEGTSDILWRQASTGNAAVWLIANGALAGSGSPGNPGLDWTVAGVGDFNGDGKADILWSNVSSGVLAIWLMNGFTIAGTTNLGSGGSGWTIAGVGDFDGDGTSDILWQHTSGSVAVWRIVAGAIAGSGVVGSASGWTSVGIGDFNGDGKADILWRNTSGALSVWLMNGFAIAGTTSLGSVASGWTVAGIGDFNGDLIRDILWREDSSGQVALWLIRGGAAATTGLVGTVSGWAIEKVGDFNGDGKADILWRNTSSTPGLMSIWLMNGLAIAGTTSLGTVALDWETK